MLVIHLMLVVAIHDTLHKPWHWKYCHTLDQWWSCPMSANNSMMMTITTPDEWLLFAFYLYGGSFLPWMTTMTMMIRWRDTATGKRRWCYSGSPWGTGQPIYSGSSSTSLPFCLQHAATESAAPAAALLKNVVAVLQVAAPCKKTMGLG